jgi:hypothetical protein
VLVIGGGPSAAWAGVGAASASVRINSTAPSGQAMAVLDLAHRQHPTDRGVLMALVSITRDSGRSPDDDWSAQIDPHRPRGPAPASFRSDLPVEPPMRTVVWRAALRRQPPRRRTEPTCSTVDRSAPEAQSEGG